MRTAKTITKDYGIDYGKPLKKSPTAGWYVYAEISAKPIDLHNVFATEEEAAERARQRQASDDRVAQRKAEEAEAAAAKATPKPAAVDAATPRQVDYIMSLILDGRHEEGGFMAGPTTRQGVEQMTRAAASAYITSLTGRY